jgi:CheY-like chemotaxis protein
MNFFRQLKGQYSTHRIPVLLTTEEPNYQKRIEYIDMGVEDYVAKPYYPEEVVARVAGLFQEFKPSILVSKSVENGFVGSLKEMNLIDLIQTMELGNKSGIINLNRGDKEGQVFINKGKIVDAVVEDYDTVERAYLHMLTWIEGSFYVVFQDIHLDNPLTNDNQLLFDEGAKIIDQWRKVIGELPSLHTHLIAVSNANTSTLAFPEKSMLAYFQGPRSIVQAIDMSDFDDFDGLKIIKSLLEKGLLIKTESHKVDEKTAGFTINPSLKAGPRDSKSKYSHVFSIFQRNRKTEKKTASQSTVPLEKSNNGDSRVPHKIRIKNTIQLTKAELLLIRQKISK